MSSEEEKTSYRGAAPDMGSDNEKHNKGSVPGVDSAGSLDHLDDASIGHLHRRLNNRQIQLIAAGGAIGTALFISIGGGLAKGGPGSLVIAFTCYSIVLALVNNSLAEMTTHMPVAGGFVRLAGHWVDDALGFVAGWNFFLYEALLIPFEVTALTFVIAFWDDNVTKPGPTAGICAAVIVAYAVLNILAVRAYGEAEFWLSGGKILLVFLLFAFTFVTMVGGNPQHDAYGFRHFKDPGSFATYLSGGDKGRFEGFLAALWSAAFTVVGPEYISMVAAEAKRPSVYIKAAFKTVYYRFVIFFIVGALAVGIVCAYNDPALRDIYFGNASSGSAAASPYVIAMENLGVKGLPHLINFLILTSIFSAGNTYTYCATRALYSLALEGRAPRFLRKVNAQGIPIWCFCVVMCFPFLSFLQLSSGSAEVLDWLVTIITGGGLVTYIIIGITFINYHKACSVQGVNRKTERPYYGYFQPYGAYIALAIQFVVATCYGYYAFRPKWNVETFFQNYTMQLLAVVLFIGWKVIKRTKYIRPHEVDLVWERPEVDAYEAALIGPPSGFWEELGHMVGFRRKKRVQSSA